MEQLQQNLRAFYRRQAQRLLAFVEKCDDPDTTGHLLAMANEYVEKLEGAPVDTMLAPNAWHGIELTGSPTKTRPVRGSVAKQPSA